MARSPKFLSPIRSRAARLTEQRAIRDRLVSVAGLVGRPVQLGDGREVGRVVDVVARWASDTYPPVTGLVVRIGRRRAFLPASDVDSLGPERVTLSSSLLDVRDFVRREGEVVLMGDVVDHQLVDVDGVQVVRASDLYLSPVGAIVRLVGVEIGVLSLLRRIGPARWRTRPTPERVIDWADVQPVGHAGTVQIDRANRELRRLRPGDLADLLETLGHPQRQELVGVLDADVAADALEEMDEAQRDHVLRHLEPQRAAAIVAEMEPDEAAEALRELPAEGRATLLAQMPVEKSAAVRTLLAYREDSAGGIMTTVLATANERDPVTGVLDRLRRVDDHRADIDGVLVVDADGRLLDDVSLFELLVVPPDRLMGELVGEPWPIVIGPDATIDEIVDAALSNRRSSIVVVDDEHHPIGRILLDDVLDALTPGTGRLHRDVGDQ